MRAGARPRSCGSGGRGVTRAPTPHFRACLRSSSVSRSGSRWRTSRHVPTAAVPGLGCRGRTRAQARRRPARARPRLSRHPGARDRALAVVVAVVASRSSGPAGPASASGSRTISRCSSRPGFRSAAISAIAAANGVIEADEDEVAFSVALVTLCGTLAIVTLPPLQRAARARRRAVRRVGRSERPRRRPGRRHLLAAGSVALATAIVVKLTRVMLLAPLDRRDRAAAIASPQRRRGRGHRSCRRSSSPSWRWSSSRASACFPIEPSRRIDDLRTVLLGWRCSPSAPASTSTGSGRSVHATRPRPRFVALDRRGRPTRAYSSPGRECRSARPALPYASAARARCDLDVLGSSGGRSPRAARGRDRPASS